MVAVSCGCVFDWCRGKSDGQSRHSSHARGYYLIQLDQIEPIFHRQVVVRDLLQAPAHLVSCFSRGILVALTRFMNEVAKHNPELKASNSLYGSINTACNAFSNVTTLQEARSYEKHKPIAHSARDSSK